MKVVSSAPICLQLYNLTFSVFHSGLDQISSRGVIGRGVIFLDLAHHQMLCVCLIFYSVLCTLQLEKQTCMRSKTK
jgi:hypothetical protein